MTREARMQTSLLITQNGVIREKREITYFEDISACKGPTPGEIAVSTSGVDVDISELTTPGQCYMENRDSTNYVEYGVYYNGTVFVPFGELGPKKGVNFKLSRRLLYGASGTAAINTFRLRANTVACRVYVGANEA